MELSVRMCLIGIMFCSFHTAQGSENIDVPLTNNLEAPLKATIDISLLNKEIVSLIKKEVKDAVQKVMEESEQKAIKEAVQNAMEEAGTGILNRKLNETKEVINEKLSTLNENVQILESKFTREVSKLRNDKGKNYRCHAIRTHLP